MENLTGAVSGSLCALILFLCRINCTIRFNYFQTGQQLLELWFHSHLKPKKHDKQEFVYNPNFCTNFTRQNMHRAPVDEPQASVTQVLRIKHENMLTSN